MAILVTYSASHHGSNVVLQYFPLCDVTTVGSINKLPRNHF